MTVSRALPDGVEPYGSSPVFTSKSVPKALLSAHTTKEGVWGRLNVLAGTVQYFLEGQTEPLAIVEKDKPWIINPAEVHFIKPSSDAEFHIEFCR